MVYSQDSLGFFSADTDLYALVLHWWSFSWFVILERTWRKLNNIENVEHTVLNYLSLLKLQREI